MTAKTVAIVPARVVTTPQFVAIGYLGYGYICF